MLSSLEYHFMKIEFTSFPTISTFRKDKIENFNYEGAKEWTNLLTINFSSEFSRVIYVAEYLCLEEVMFSNIMQYFYYSSKISILCEKNIAIKIDPLVILMQDLYFF